MKKLRYMLEALALLFGVALFRLLPLDLASWLGGRVACMIGPFHKSHRTAQQNLARALPHLSASEQRRLLRGMWDNLGRIVGEFPHMGRPVMERRITVRGREHADALAQTGGTAMFISGHLGNWEAAPRTATLLGMRLLLIYRRLNNPYADRLLHWFRRSYCLDTVPKGRKGAMEAIEALKTGQPVGMLIDQKMNEGVALPFFGHDAMTPTGPAELAIKYSVPILPAYVRRTRGAHFITTVLPPIRLSETGDAATLMRHLNRLLEGWITEAPEQWFWVHHRWPKH